MKQSNIFVLDKCEVNEDNKLFSEPHVDLHKLRTSKSVRLCPVLHYGWWVSPGTGLGNTDLGQGCSVLLLFEFFCNLPQHTFLRVSSNFEDRFRNRAKLCRIVGFC